MFRMNDQKLSDRDYNELDVITATLSILCQSHHGIWFKVMLKRLK